MALEPLDRRVILKHLGTAADGFRDRLTLLEEADSTSRVLLARVADADFHGSVCVAESQPRGRGRRGRAWVTTPYHNLMLSMGWRFSGAPAAMTGLSLAAGLAILEALEDYGVREGGLKWPNDILWDGRKLAGLLVDLQGEASGPCAVVLGVGINGYLDPRAARTIDQPWVDLHTITGRTVQRNRIAALVMARLRAVFTRFDREGFAPFVPTGSDVMSFKVDACVCWRRAGRAPARSSASTDKAPCVCAMRRVVSRPYSPAIFRCALSHEPVSRYRQQPPQVGAGRALRVDRAVGLAGRL